MAEKSSSFLGGFILGTIVGSALGVILGSKVNQVLDQAQEDNDNPGDQAIAPATAEEIAAKTKLGLEQKIAQLNAAIDAVSKELSTSETNGKSPQLEKF
ncbi:hypothetical protein Syn7502_01868 [Synechococcus sp. PCC 7502]|uniref:hypothetical protein n=1 Tax=Synechococcus sp. PCC 7502 TaxID=1173263 RepID=UPI00029FA6A3|nr:hypothetical protein [Synechococcus sp. PCC 7502]AFY73902.1 hypothetical protein Syn7502_01868 [Synechococcus sp. PCC 7502]